MTYCLGIKTAAGILGFADTRITTGTETTTARKAVVINRPKHSMIIMTSGLRSVRDKAITYFNEVIDEKDEGFNKMYQAVNAFGEQVKRVASEDQQSLQEAGYQFNLYAIVGGQLEHDDTHKLYLLYPQGNWIEVGVGTPFVIIGNSGYGKPILNRALKYSSSLDFALKCAFLSFDATRISANDVGYPVDIALYKKNSYHFTEKRFTQNDLNYISEFWSGKLAEAINTLPSESLDTVFGNSSHREVNGAL